jgi:hypothetical protein
MTISTRLSQYVAKEKVKPYDLVSRYEPQKTDVICGKRGRGIAYNHTGNARMRVVVDMHLQRYNPASSKKEKSSILQDIVDSVRVTGGHFLSFESGS